MVNHVVERLTYQGTLGKFHSGERVMSIPDQSKPSSYRQTSGPRDRTGLLVYLKHPVELPELDSAQWVATFL